MSTLVLRLAGPMQAWGTGSRFAYRGTDQQPSKSGVLGLLAAAQGRRRTDELEDLLGLSFGARRDQPGRVVRDFQTAISLDGTSRLPLTYRYYLADAAFLVAVEGQDGMVGTLADSLRSPQFPLFLGRRSCPPSGPLLVEVSDLAYDVVLRTHDWVAADHVRPDSPPQVSLEIVRDARSDEASDEVVDDVPLSFDPQHRRFASRPVVREWTAVVNAASAQREVGHDPFALLGRAP